MTASNESRTTADSTDEPAPLTLQRVQKCLAGRGYAFAEDDEHPEILRAGFDNYRFQFTLAGEGQGVLQTRGRWNHSVEIARKLELVKLCNEWNMNRIWPKVYVRRESEELVGVYGETAADFRAGATDAQIDSAITCGLSTVITFFHSLEDHFGPEVDEFDR